MSSRSVQLGDTIPALTLPPLTRTTLALYAGGSGDHIPLHIDSDYARSVGYPDVFMHGMLGAAYVSRLLTTWVTQEQLRTLDVRFVAITFPGEMLVASGVVSAVDVDAVAGRTRVDVMLRNTNGETKLTGYAIVEQPL